MQVTADPDRAGDDHATVEHAAHHDRQERRAAEDSEEASDHVVDHGSTLGRSAVAHNMEAVLWRLLNGTWPDSSCSYEGTCTAAATLKDGYSVETVDRKKAYFWMMGTCLGLILLAWNVVRFFSVPLAVGMSIVAALIPPAAAIVANWRRGG